ncbi:MAG: carboxypeptidase regulatory-like domain-containing protein, partial [Longimicrobiales bacterium]
MYRLLCTGGGGRSSLLLLFLSAALYTGAALPRPIAAQSVQGQIQDRETLAPVEGVLVLLVGRQGEEHDGYLTNAAGRFFLRAPGPGTYTIRAERIGYESVTSDAFTLQASQLFGLRLEMKETAIQLDELRVEGEQQCVVRPEEGMDLARVWEEARKALSVQDWTEREGLYRFQVVNYQRDMDASARMVEAETRRVTSGVSSSPIRSLPAEELMERGFIQRLDDGGWEYFGPDAAVLLSDEFLDSHCFRLRSSRDNPGALGLAFEPVRGTDHPDIQGTLWLDRETAALQFLEFRYTWAEYAEAEGVARGRVEFKGLPNGAWIVRKWWIRMPKLSQDVTMAKAGRTGVYVSGIREAGAEVAQISTLDRQRIAQMERGFLTGIVWDSTRYVPLGGANVFLSGTSYATVTDAGGRFLMDGIPEGVFTAAFTHPRLDTLGVLAAGVTVEVIPGEVSEVRLGIPSTGSILVEACRGEERRWGAGVIFGTVRDRVSGEPIPRATVRLDWQEVAQAGRGRIAGQGRWFEASTDSEGRYTVCSVPGDHLIVIRATFMDRRSDTVHVRVPEDSYKVVDLVVDLPPGLVRPATEAVVPAEGVGVQGVQGFILEPESGEPVRNAAITLRQPPGATLVSGETNERGFFRLKTPFSGSYTLS